MSKRLNSPKSAALIKAGKRFGFFVFPGQRHGYGDMSELRREREQTGDKKAR